MTTIDGSVRAADGEVLAVSSCDRGCCDRGFVLRNEATEPEGEDCPAIMAAITAEPAEIPEAEQRAGGPSQPAIVKGDGELIGRHDATSVADEARTVRKEAVPAPRASVESAGKPEVDTETVENGSEGQGARPENVPCFSPDAGGRGGPGNGAALAAVAPSEPPPPELHTPAPGRSAADEARQQRLVRFLEKRRM